MGYLWETDERICYDRINPTQYLFHDDTETCTPVYTTFYADFGKFYEECGRLFMSLSVRLNYAVPDGYLLAKVFRLVEEEIGAFVERGGGGDLNP